MRWGFYLRKKVGAFIDPLKQHKYCVLARVQNILLQGYSAGYSEIDSMHSCYNNARNAAAIALKLQIFVMKLGP